jgi:hypothetical protein
MRGNQVDVNLPLPQSLLHVARLGLRNADAQGYAIDQLMADGEAGCDGGPKVWLFPPRTVAISWLSAFCGLEDDETGALAFVLRGKTVSDETRRQLTQIATATQSIWQLWQVPSVYARNVIAPCS